MPAHHPLLLTTVHYCPLLHGFHSGGLT